MDPTSTPATRPVSASSDSWADRARSAVGALAAQLARDEGPISSGDKAGLRRGWDEPHGPAFWRVAVRELESRDLLQGTESERDWGAVVAGLAETAALHDPRQAFGRAMAQAGVTEARLLRLLRADDETLRRALRGVVRQLASAGQRFDWREPALLVLASHKDRIRHQIAMSYYRSAASRKTGETKNEGE